MFGQSSKHFLRGNRSWRYIKARRIQSALPDKLSSFEYFKDGIYKSEFDGVPLNNHDICSYVFPRWLQWKNLEALECVSTGRKMTYGSLLEASLRFGGALQNLRIKSIPDVVEVSPSKVARIPQRISILSPNVLEYAPVVYGTLAAGFSLATINTNYKVGEIMLNLQDAKPQLLVVHESWEDLADQALNNLKMKIPVLTIGLSKRGRPNIQDILKDSKQDKILLKNPDPSDVALVLYSNGTTGKPKGVAIPHSAVNNNIDGYTDPKLYAYGMTVNPHQTVIGMMPFFHVYGLHIVMLSELAIGSKILVFKEFDKNIIGKVIKQHQLQYLHLVPTLLNFLTKSSQITKEDLSTVKGVFIASAPVLPSSAIALQEKVARDISFQEGYGMTEILGSHLTPAKSCKIGYCGKLVPNTEAKIVDLETRELLGPGSKGELLIKGTSTMSHYLNNPKATAETIDDDGWLHTGDVAVSTDDGYFSIIDRIKDLIKVKGFQVSPSEIEDLLTSHPAVSEASVVGIPDERKGEIPRAYITLKEHVTKDELSELVEENLASYKSLTGGIVFLKSLPKSPAGKILKKQLKIFVMEDVKKL